VRRTLRAALAAILTMTLLAPTTGALADDADEHPPVEPTSARVGPFGSVAVLGDSISAATGSTGAGQDGAIGAIRPRNSWATGDWPGLDSVVQRLSALRDEPAVGSNLAQNGARSQDVLGQVQQAPAEVDHVLIQIGGNDLCRPTVADMTPVDTYRANVDAALDWLEEHRPDAVVQINSVPDIYRLWEIRRTNFVAVLFWGLGLVPCQSLLANPTSTSAANMARRAQVRDRGLAYNDALRDTCEARLRCRYDDDATWQFSNDPALFVDGDISTQDHFHPSYQGQRKLAEVSWEAGYDATDTSAPELAFSVTPPATDAGWHAGDVEVTVTATDDVAVAGLEVRVHDPAADTTPAFEPVLAETTTLEVADPGVSWVEARALDVNGNLSASELLPVRIDTTAPTVALDAPDDGTEVVLNAEVAVDAACDDAGGSGVVACEVTGAADGRLDTSTVGEVELVATATDGAGNVTTASRSYRVVYAVEVGGVLAGAADEPLRLSRRATVPVRVSVADAVGTEVAGLAPGLVLVDADGVRRDAGQLVHEPLGDRYLANLSLRQLGVPAGAYTLVLVLDDGTERTIAALALT
jgi:lysophospholipase L1-like esterase